MIASFIRSPSSELGRPASVLCPPVSVILPVRNEAPFIEETLCAVLAQDYPHDLMEVIVVDGMSEDGTREIVRELAAQDRRLRLRDNSQRITPAGLNLGIRAARGEVIVRVDGHGVLPPNYVRECVAVLREKQKAESRKRKSEDGEQGVGGKQWSVVSGQKSVGGGQKSVGGGQRSVGGGQRSVGGRQRAGGRRQWPEVGGLLAVGGAWDSVGRGWVGEAIALATSSRFGVGGSLYRTCSPEHGPVLTDSVPFWVVRREVFERIGLFREEMLCHEDYEFNYRLRSAGGTILLLPWLRSKYYVRSTLGGLAQQYWRYGIWKGRFLRSHPESLKARHLIPLLFVAVLAAGALASFLGAAGRLGLGSLVALYVCFLLAATTSLACSRGRRREGVLPKSFAFLKVGSAVPSAPGDVAQTRTFRTSSDARGALGTARPTAVLLPLVLATLHLCWGAGVWVGLLRGKVAGQPPRLAPVPSAHPG